MNLKKAAAILIVIAIIAGWAVSAIGFGEGGSIADRMSLGLDMIGGVSVVLEAETNATGAELKSIMDQVEAVMERRVNEMGLSEPVIAVENENRIRIELPGAQNAEEAIESIGRTAKLRFVTADGMAFLDGDHVKNAVASAYEGYDTNLMGFYVVNLEFDAQGQTAFEQATRSIIEGNMTGDYFDDNQIAIFLDDDLISAPYVSQVISSANCQITGSFTKESASNLAALIRGGSLPVTLNEIQTEIVGPTLGLNAARTAVIAGLIGIALIFVIMIAGYQVMGIVADIALALYVLLELWILIALHAVLTLPGIAGMILSIGMAVDSNVIIFSRIREEISVGKTIRVAVRSGYRRALSTIIDSQVTTIIAAVILYEFGSGQVRGFALTLLIGIIVSLFTAVVISNLLLQVLAETKLATPKLFGVRKIGTEFDEQKLPLEKFNFVDKRRIFYIITACILVIGLAIGGIRGFNLGIDFTGGTQLQLNMGQQVDSGAVKAVLQENGVNDADIKYAGSANEKIIIRTTNVLSNEDRTALSDAIRSAFGITTEGGEFVEQAGLIGPSVGSQLKSNALKAMGLAALAMLIYVAIRFEWRYGIASVLALCHDTLLLFGIYGLLHLQMNSPFISGLLIVIGYSINDTIVIFDRIRENSNYAKKPRLEKLVDLSIHQTLSRSIMTSLTTLLAILPLIFMGGETIRAFTAPLIIGVLGGTVSSICIAPNLYYEICKLTKKNKYKGA